MQYPAFASRSFCVLLLVAFAAAGCDSSNTPLSLHLRMAALGVAAVQAPAEDPDLVTLGQALMFDKILSGNMDISCATCHHPAFATTDGIPLPIGTGGSGLGPARIAPVDGMGDPIFIPRNAPEAFNRGSLSSMFWDARVADNGDGTFMSPAGMALLPGLDNVAAVQAMFPVTSRHEMRGEIGESELGDLADSDLAGIWSALMTRLLSFQGYRDLFAAAYPGVAQVDLTFAHAANAIAAFEIEHWTLPDSNFDRWLGGEETALTDMQLAGAELFYGRASCFRCHTGAMFTDEMFHNTGVPQLGPGKGHGMDGTADFGREGVTGDPADRYKFRTPPLRNVAVTGPYMHDGAFTDLADVVRRYNDIPASARDYDASQLPMDLQGLVRTDQTEDILASLDPLLPNVTLTDDEVNQLVAFLDSLTAPDVFALESIDVPVSVPSGLPIAD